MPLRVALPLLAVVALVAHAAGGIRAERRAAFDQTYQSVAFETKGNLR